MKDARGQQKAEKQSKLEAVRCCTCHRWFTVRKASRVVCFRCEEEGQASGNNRQKGPAGVRVLKVWLRHRYPTHLEPDSKNFYMKKFSQWNFELMNADREHLETVLVALDASPRALERAVCRGWVGDWQITGTGGHIMTDGHSFPFYAAGESPRRWSSIKRRLSFCRLTQDGDDEGCFLLDRLPTSAEAVTLRDVLGIRRRRHLSPDGRSALERARDRVQRRVSGDFIRHSSSGVSTHSPPRVCSPGYIVSFMPHYLVATF